MSVLKGSEHLRLSLKEIQSATNNFNKRIGKGGYGMVFKGELSISGRSTTVAVKRLNVELGQGLKEFLTEIQLLSGQNHKNVVSLLGYCDEGEEKSLVYEYAANGSLDVHIKNRDTSLSWRKRLEICLDAARGLNHLHSNSRNKQTIIHRDVKSANILLDHKWVGKIADLGLSKLNYESSEGSSIVSNACGTKGYFDPEYRFNSILKKECDVYSFGIVLFEILCGRLCLVSYIKDDFVLSGESVQKYYKENRITEIIDPSLKEQMSSYSISKFSEVAYKCLLEDKTQRPSMDRVVKELEELLLIQAKEVESLKSNSCSSDPISDLRSEKVRRIFRRFDVNRDGVLSKEELANFFHVLGQHNLSDWDGIRKKIKHMNLLKTKQDYKHKYFGPGLVLKAKDLKHKYYGPGASRKYQELLQDVSVRMENLLCDHQTPYPLTEREITKAIDIVFSLFGESTTNGEIGLTCDGMLRFYDNGADVLHDHFEFLQLDCKPFDDSEDSFRTMERYGKVKRIFQRFDMNKDGYLDEIELHMFLLIISPDQDEAQRRTTARHIPYLFSGCFEGGKGLNCDGMFMLYSSGIDRIDVDFEKLNLTLKPLNANELALRYEKVRRMFQRFDINEDGGLDREELTELVCILSENKPDKEVASSFVDYIFSVLKEFTDGEKGLTCDGLLHYYDFGVDDLDNDFKKLRLDLKPLDGREDALRKMKRAEKVRTMFDRFDLNRDGGLDKSELGLTYDGLLRTYDHGIDSLDVDFETLGLELRNSTEIEDASRKRDRSEKVRQIFKRFDINGDGGLDKIEMASYLAAVHPEDQLSEEKMTSTVNYMFQFLGEFVDSVTGLRCDGLIKNYDYGEDNLDAHFRILNLR